MTTGPPKRALMVAIASVAAATVVTGGTGAAQEGPPAPVLGRSVNVALVKGIVLVKPKGQKRFHRLTGLESIPTGSLVDTRRGRVGLTSAIDTYGSVRTGEFWAGLFKVLQRRRTNAITDLNLRGRLANCGKKSTLGEPAAAAAAKRKKGRRLWGNGKGRFRTRGKRSSALVRGTKWLVYDQCDSSTYNAVRTGTVDVRDFRLNKTIRLGAGRIYIAR